MKQIKAWQGWNLTKENPFDLDWSFPFEWSGPIKERQS